MDENIVTVQTVDGNRKVSIRKFIEDELYGALDLLITTDKKQEHVYFAFEIIATGIEFLGACMDPYKFNDSNYGKARFTNAINTFPSLKGYAKFKLYENLRCGMCHVLLPKLGLKLARGYKSSPSDNNTLYIDSFYKDFRTACEDLLKPGSTLWGNGKGSEQPCWKISTDDHNSTPTTSVTNNDKVTVK